MRNLWLAILAFQAISVGQSVSLSLVDEDIVIARLRRLKRDNKERRQTLEEIFQEAGCVEPALSSHKVRSASSPNLICELKGEPDAPIIIVSAHFDKVRAGAGAIDNWSGASLLPSFYQALVRGPAVKHTFLFIAFTDEEQGLVGSRAWVKDHKKSLLKDVRAVVNIDSVGAGPLYIWHTQANPELEQIAMRVSQAMKFPLTWMSADQVGQSDTLPFREAKTPSIDFHSLDKNTFPILHTIDDQLSAMKFDEVKSTYRFLAFYLALLDKSLYQRSTGK